VGLVGELAHLIDMPAKDIYHDVVKRALVKDGWKITHDPLMLRVGAKDMYVDLGAERLVAAEKAGHKIAVEVKSFVSPSEMDDLEKAVGQYILYHDALIEREPDRTLYLAVPKDIQRELFDEPVGQMLLKYQRVQLMVFDPRQEVVLRWIP
jgi:hypothetical protein